MSCTYLPDARRRDRGNFSKYKDLSYAGRLHVLRLEKKRRTQQQKSEGSDRPAHDENCGADVARQNERWACVKIKQDMAARSHLGWLKWSTTRPFQQGIRQSIGQQCAAAGGGGAGGERTAPRTSWCPSPSSCPGPKPPPLYAFLTPPTTHVPGPWGHSGDNKLHFCIFNQYVRVTSPEKEAKTPPTPRGSERDRRRKKNRRRASNGYACGGSGTSVS